MMDWQDVHAEEKWQRILARNESVWKYPVRSMRETGKSGDWWQRLVSANAALGPGVSLEELRFGDVVWSLGDDLISWDRVSCIKVGKELYVAWDSERKAMTIWGSRKDSYGREKRVPSHCVSSDGAINRLLQNLVQNRPACSYLGNIDRQKVIMRMLWTGIACSVWALLYRNGWISISIFDALNLAWQGLASTLVTVWNLIWSKL